MPSRCAAAARRWSSRARCGPAGASAVRWCGRIVSGAGRCGVGRAGRGGDPADHLLPRPAIASSPPAEGPRARAPAGARLRFRNTIGSGGARAAAVVLTAGADGGGADGAGADGGGRMAARAATGLVPRRREALRGIVTGSEPGGVTVILAPTSLRRGGGGGAEPAAGVTDDGHRVRPAGRDRRDRQDPSSAVRLVRSEDPPTVTTETARTDVLDGRVSGRRVLPADLRPGRVPDAAVHRERRDAGRRRPVEGRARRRPG